MTGRRYAICKICRKTWNISVGADTDPYYLCPRCRQRKRKDGAGRLEYQGALHAGPANNTNVMK